LVKPLPLQCRLTAVFDACHSGTVLDLPYVYSSKGVVKEIKHQKQIGSFVGEGQLCRCGVLKR